ncbi:Ribonuclease HII [Tepidimonas alkaliphilus]|uniref:Ribonuclease HII n=1 Tax=Tepidimonas alkaliphilus TaxID=2588942 RepID=A0A554WA95_9BURK|nr:ribonuclease HII [Tepidimonas alkaliphilus]TSE20499.1 Ribonuclease HII [Tepidimonas alkaliphilus]
MRADRPRRRPARSNAGHAAQLALDWDDGGLVAGVDEAGRGPLAGPVVAAAVILDPGAPIDGVADSKALSPARRERLFDAIHARARAVAVGLASVEEIDRLNILQATLLAMQRAVAALSLRPTRVRVDGNRLPALPVPAEAVVGGDATVAAIAAASIVAKVTRDRLMDALHREYPDYGFDRHRGYGTAQHLQALSRLGPTPAHRRSFAPVARALAAALEGGRR